MAVGALYRDQNSRVLLVDPVYRDTWDLPGDAVEAEESPQTACRLEAIIVPGGELAGYQFVHPDQVAGRVTPLVARRIASSLEALAAGTVASLAGGSPTD